MSVDIRLPNINASTDTEKIAQITKYIYQLTEQLNYSFNTIETTYDTYQAKSSSSGSSSLESDDEKLLETYHSIKDMIVKSADFTQSMYEEVKSRLSGSYVATSDFGSYLENTTVEIEGNSVGFTQLYSYTAGIRSNFADFDVNNQSYIKTGLLYYDNSQPVYGVGVGILSATTDGNGRNVLDRDNLLATYTAEEIAFWGNDTKLAYITPTQVYFPSGMLTAYGATITGNITANDGNIGGWNITSSYIDSTVSNSTKRLYLASAADSSSYWIGAIDASGNDVFHVTKLGELYARGADIGGNISADTGNIGGWSITDGRISKSVTYSSTDYVAMMNAPSSFGTNSPSDYVAFGVKKGSNFVSYIDYEGNLHSKNGTIAGWDFNDYRFSKSYTIGGHTYLSTINAPEIMSTVSGMVAFGVAVDNTYKAYIDWEGKLVAKDADIKGKITATSGSFTGTVTCGSGSIGGWVIGSNYIRSPNGSYGTYRYTTTGTNIIEATGYLFAYLSGDGIEYKLYSTNSTSSTLVASFRSFTKVSSGGGTVV